MIFKFLSFLITISFFSFLFSQNAKWENFYTGYSVNALAEEQNYIWIGLRENGLIRYDKNTGDRIFYNNSNTSIPLMGVGSIAIDKTGNKWITSNGLYKFDNYTWTLFTSKNSDLPSTNISSLKFDSSDQLWITTRYDGLAIYNGYSWKIFNKDNSDIPTNNLICLEFVKDTVWIGSDMGLIKYDGLNWSLYNTSNSGLPNNKINCIASEESGTLWIGTDYNDLGALAKYQNNNWSVFGYNEIRTHYIFTAVVDKKNIKWFGSSNGLIRLKGENWKVYDEKNSGLSSRNVKEIIVGNDNLKWIGSSIYGGGSYVVWGAVNSFDGSNWDTVLTSNSGLSSNSIYVIDSDDDVTWIGGIRGLTKYTEKEWSNLFPNENIYEILLTSSRKWLGTNEGLLVNEGSRWKRLNTKNSKLADNHITTLSEDKRGNVWVGTATGGLVRIFEENWAVYNYNNSGLPSNRIYSVANDKFGNTWIGTDSGLVKLKLFFLDDGMQYEIWDTYNTENSDLPSNKVSSIAIDSFDNKWLGTFRKGLAKFDNNNWTIYNKENSFLESDDVRKVKYYNDSIWVGTFYEGVIKFKDNDWTSYNVNNSGIGGRNISDIHIDNHNDLWIGDFYAGLSKLNRKNITNLNYKSYKEIKSDGNIQISQNVPNPFNNSTKIKFHVPKSGYVELKIYNILGEKVLVLIDRFLPKGEYNIKFSAKDLSSGLYIYQINYLGKIYSKKMLLVK